jgi:Lrp/AsnC family transcriptional regulator for asnA, asnC and gidA
MKQPCCQAVFCDILTKISQNLRNSYLFLEITAKSLVFSTKTLETRGMSKVAVLDDVSKAIIEQLQQDGRRPYATIGKAVGLSEAAVRQRVSKLLETGVMQIVAVTDPLQVGFNREAMIGIEVDGDMEAVADVLSLMDEISYIILTAGSFDIILEVVCEDDEALLEVINRKIRAIPGVRRTETFMYLKLRKQSYTWGTR